MNREEKQAVIASLAEKLNSYSTFYITDIADLNAEQTAKLRRNCFEKEINLVMVKNTLFIKALEQTGKHCEELGAVLKGSSSVMFSNTGKAPAVLIQEFRKQSDKPILKAAFVQECFYVGDQCLDELSKLKSREELIGDVIALLQSPAKRVISALQGAAGQKIAGLVKTLEEREN